MAAPKTIKGITIEIAGDTKKLGAALKNIDEQSQDLAANLKYVDKLLDFDPGNTELLAEKQKLLADAVENTGERLEALKEIQDQVSRQYQTGEIGQRAYLDFQHELAKTERKLESLKAESERLDRSLNDTGAEARDTGKDLGELGKDADGAAGDLGDLGSGLGDLVGTIKGLGIVAAIGGVVSKIGEITEETREYREEMAKLDISYEAAKLSAEDAEIAYSNLYRLLGETDQSVEAAQQIALLASSTQDVVRWASVAPGVVARFGDALQPETFFEGANETLKLGEATGAYVQMLEQSGVITVEAFNKRLAEMSTAEQKQQYMLAITELILGDAAKAYEERNDQVLAARDADAKLTEAMSKLGEEFEPVITGLKNISAEVVERAAPAIGEIITVFGDAGTAMGDFFEQAHMSKEDWLQVATTVGTVASDVGGWIKEFFSNLSWNILEGQTTMAVALGEVSADSAQMVRDIRKSTDEVEKIEWSLPKPKVPVFGIRGKFSLNPPSVPELNISWNAKGGIFASPMVLPAMDGSLQGFGEAGQEAILPLNSFYENLERIVDRRSGPQSIVFEPHLTIYQQSGEDGEAVAQRAAELMMDKFYQEVGGFGQSG